MMDHKTRDKQRTLVTEILTLTSLVFVRRGSARRSADKVTSQLNLKNSEN